MTQLDLLTEHAATERAIEQAGRNAGDEWNDQADRVVYDLAHRVESFIADDIWSAGLEKPHEARALGNVLRRAARAGLIVGTDQFIPSGQAGNHCVPRRVWKSLYFEGGE